MITLDRRRAAQLVVDIRAGRLDGEAAVKELVIWARAATDEAVRETADIFYYLADDTQRFTVAALARACRLPYQLMYRRVQDLEAAGALSYAPNAGFRLLCFTSPPAAVGAACRFTGAVLGEMRRADRHKGAAAARHRVCWIACEVSGAPADVAAVLGRDPSTVHNSGKRHAPTDADRAIVERMLRPVAA